MCWLLWIMLQWIWECKHLFNPLQYSCLESPVDRGAWWSAVHGVTQSQTLLKWLSSSSNSKHLFELLFLFPLDKYLEEKLLDHIVALFLIFEVCSYYFPQWLHQFTFLPIVYKGSFFPISSQTLVISYLFVNSHSNRCEVISYCSFDLHLSNY